MLFDWANLSYWILLGIGVFLYLFVIFSGGGEDDIEADIEADLDVDVDADIDGDVDSDLDGESDFSVFSLLSWFGFGQAPLMLLLATDCSLWGLLGWIFNVWLGSALGSIPTGLLGTGVFVASGAIALWIGKLLAYPLGKIFASFGEDASSDRLIGCVGTVISKQLPHYTEGKVGQADVYDAARNMVTISVSLPHWAQVIPKRDQSILIIDRTEHSYLAIAKESSDEDRWLQNSNLDRDTPHS